MSEESKTKVCKCCGRELPLGEFMVSNRSNDGYTHQCRECVTKKMSEGHKAKAINLYDYVVGRDEEKLNPELEAFKPRDLIAHLRALGYKGELTFSVKVKL